MSKLGSLTAEGLLHGEPRHVEAGASASLNERILLGAIIPALLVLLSLPALFGYLSSPPDKRFMGIVLNVPDTAQYLAWARASTDAVLIENTLTSEPGDAVFLNVLWLFAGRLAGVLGLEPSEMLQVLRPIAGAAYLGAIFWFVALLTRDVLQRWATFFVIVLGAGLGWLLVVAKQFTGVLAFPLDLNIMEANTFLTIMAFPHQAMAGALVVSILCLSIRAFERASMPFAVSAGVLGLLLGLQHGYDLLVVYAVVGCVALVVWFRRRSNFTPLALGVAICGPSVLAAVYLLYLTRQSPIWREVLAQYSNAGVYTPHPGHLLILMGVPLVLVVIAGIRFLVLAWRDGLQWELPRGVRELMLLTWLIAGFALLYIPTDFQVKMLAAWQVPVGVYATRFVFAHVVPAVERHLRLSAAVAVAVLLIAAVIPTNLYHFAWRFVDLGRHDHPYYLDRDELAALHWLEANAERTDVVLSSLTIGQYIPSVSGNRAFLGHWAATLDFFSKRQLAAWFFDSRASDMERHELLGSYGVRYVFHGRPERALGDFNPEQASQLSKVFSSQNAAVYVVTSPLLAGP